MRPLTEDAKLICPHTPGRVKLHAGQSLVRVDGSRLLVKADPVGCNIQGCPNSVGMSPCLNTLSVVKAYSGLIYIDGRPVCLDTLEGFSNGTPPGNLFWVAKGASGQKMAGQSLLDEKGGEP